MCGLYEVSEKRKDKTRHATVVYEDTWLEPWNCLLLCNVAAGQWAGNPAKMKSVIVSGTASMDQCPLMSSLCVSIKIRQFGWKAFMHQACSLFCPLSWKSINQESGRHAPNMCSNNRSLKEKKEKKNPLFTPLCDHWEFLS